MARIDFKTLVRFLLITGGALAFSYMIDQYYIAGRGYTFFFDILKL